MQNHSEELTVTELAIQAVINQLAINKEKEGREFYRKPYDLALHIVHAIKGAGVRLTHAGTWPSARAKARAFSEMRGDKDDLAVLPPIELLEMPVSIEHLNPRLESELYRRLEP